MVYPEKGKCAKTTNGGAFATGMEIERWSGELKQKCRREF